MQSRLLDLGAAIATPAKARFGVVWLGSDVYVFVIPGRSRGVQLDRTIHPITLQNTKTTITDLVGPQAGADALRPQPRPAGGEVSAVVRVC